MIPSNHVNNLIDFANAHPLLIAVAVVWTLVWKGLALWRAASLRQSYWFLAILLINTFGILEIIYLFLIARNYEVEVIEQNE